MLSHPARVCVLGSQPDRSERVSTRAGGAVSQCRSQTAHGGGHGGGFCIVLVVQQMQMGKPSDARGEISPFPRELALPARNGLNSSALTLPGGRFVCVGDVHPWVQQLPGGLRGRGVLHADKCWNVRQDPLVIRCVPLPKPYSLRHAAVNAERRVPDRLIGTVFSRGARDVGRPNDRSGRHD